MIHKYLTIKELKERIKDLPDNGKVYYEQVKDSYFQDKKSGWELKRMPNEYTKGNEFDTDNYIEAFTTVDYKDGNLYITAFY